jgi:hypothetical protein
MSTDTKTVINNQHALKWAVIGWLAERDTIVFWSTHRHAEARLVYEAVLDALLYTGIGLRVTQTHQARGAEEIRLANGSRVIFRARASQSHRGVSADKLIVDEAAEITEEQLGAFLPVISACGGEVVYSR